MSKSQPADLLGVSPAQVIANEDGASRIGAIRLAEIAGVLKVPISAFFDGLREDGAEPRARSN